MPQFSSAMSSVAEKMYRLCGAGESGTDCCDRVCECCVTEKKIHKEDIEYSFTEPSSLGVVPPSLTADTIHSQIVQQPRARSESEATSRTDSVSSAAHTPSYAETPVYPDGRERRPSCASPFIDMKPIEFWAANRETVQPKISRRRYPSENEITVDTIQKNLYTTNSETPRDESGMTDEEKMTKFKLGQIHYGIQYFYSKNVLQVKIINAKELMLPYNFDEARQDYSHSNPYCKICLLPDRTNAKQTSVQRKTQTPEWDEYFEFEVSFQEVQRRTLEILVKDFDKFSRHRVIGQVTMNLEDKNLVKGYHTWKSLTPCAEEQQHLGEIVLSLNYLPCAGRLNIDIVKAKQLPQTDIVGGSDPFVKVTWVDLEKPVKTKKTSCKRKTLEPEFNESISFNITENQLENTSIVITVWDDNSRAWDDMVGRVVLGKYASGPHEITHWKRMLKTSRTPVSQWHSLRTRAECDQVSPASIAVS